jgi:hypothetical protein
VGGVWRSPLPPASGVLHVRLADGQLVAAYLPRASHTPHRACIWLGAGAHLTEPVPVPTGLLVAAHDKTPEGLATIHVSTEIRTPPIDPAGGPHPLGPVLPTRIQNPTTCPTRWRSCCAHIDALGSGDSRHKARDPMI